MELKQAVAVCLISLFSATLVVLIARTLDSQAASRLEPHLERIAEQLEAIRAGGGISAAPRATASRGLEPGVSGDGVVVFYFHRTERCPTCEAIESQSHEVVHNDFAAELDSGELAWQTINYEEPANAELTEKFEIAMPVVVVARIKDGEVEDWESLDRVWGLVGDEPEFAEFVRGRIEEMLGEADSKQRGG